MLKSKKIIIIILLIISVLAVPFTSGILTKHYLDSILDSMSTYNSVNLKVSHYQAGYLSSQVKIKIEPTLMIKHTLALYAKSDKEAKEIALNPGIELNCTIQHWPVINENSSMLGFLTGIVICKYQNKIAAKAFMAWNDAEVHLDKIAFDSFKFATHATLSLNNNPVVIYYSRGVKDRHYRINTKRYDFKATGIHYWAQNVKGSFASQHHPSGLPIVKTDYLVEQGAMAYSLPNMSTKSMQFNNFSVNATLDVKNNLIDANFIMKSETFDVDNFLIKDLTVDMNISGISATTTSKMFNAILASYKKADPKVMQAENMKIGMQYMGSLFMGSPRIHIKQLKATTPNGKLDIMLDMKLDNNQKEMNIFNMMQVIPKVSVVECRFKAERKFFDEQAVKAIKGLEKYIIDDVAKAMGKPLDSPEVKQLSGNPEGLLKAMRDVKLVKDEGDMSSVTLFYNKGNVGLK